MKRMLFILGCVCTTLVQAQVAITTDGTPPDPSAMLDIKSANKGLLIPRMTQLTRLGMTNPATGLLVYQTDNTPGFYFNAGTPAAPFWSRVGELLLPYLGSFEKTDPAMHIFSVQSQAFRGESQNLAGPTIEGVASATSGTVYGIAGSAVSPYGAGVYGYASAATGTATGVKGRSMAGTGYGVFGENTAETGNGYGVYGKSFSNSGIGVIGEAVSGTGLTTGVKGSTSSTEGKAVWGIALASSGQTHGLFGTTLSTLGTGVHGLATAATGTTVGVRGGSNSETGVGVLGYATAAAGFSKGVEGFVNSPTGYSGYFTGGRMYVGSNLGIGVAEPVHKLEVDGQLKIIGGNPGLGKVLTSDAAGLASWQAAPGLLLPFSGDASSASAAFSINQSGTGSAIYVYNPAESGAITTISAHNNSSSGTGIAANMHAATGTATGIAGFTQSASGTGVLGHAASLTGEPYGVKGLVESPLGFSGYFDGGVFYVGSNAGFGTNEPTAKVDIVGQIKIQGGSPGLGKVLTCSNNTGLASWQIPASGIVLPYSGSVSINETPAFSVTNGGFGNTIVGHSANTSSFSKTGVSGILDGPSGAGVSGEANSTNGINYGVRGYSVSDAGCGVFGSASHATGNPIGVKGQVVSAQAYAGYFEGGRFYIGGNTGIGTLNPSQKLHLKGNTPGNAVLFIEPNKWDAAGDFGELRFGDNNHYIRGEHTTGMTFYDANKFLFKGGNLGIGVDIPAAKLDVAATQGPNIIIRDADGSNSRPGLQFVNNYIHYIAGDDASEEIFGFYSGFGSTRSYAARVNIHGPATDNWGKNLSLTHNGSHGFITTDAGYLILSPAGMRVGIGTETPGFALHVNGEAAKSSGTTAWIVSSDSRLKDLQGPYTKGLQEIAALHPVLFKYKAGNSRQLPSDHAFAGFVAQDVQKVFPEAVSAGSDGYFDFNMHSINVALVNAVKELKTENEQLRKRLEKLEKLILEKQ